MRSPAWPARLLAASGSGLVAGRNMIGLGIRLTQVATLTVILLTLKFFIVTPAHNSLDVAGNTLGPGLHEQEPD